MEREIISLALVKATYSQYDFKRDYIENFVPFIANLVRKQEIKTIDLDKLEDILNAFRKEFGLNIPYLPMLTILERCKKRGLFKREYNKLIAISEKIQEYDFGDLVVQKEAKISELLQDIMNYGKQKFSIAISKDEAQNVLLNYLSSHDMDIIFATQGDAILPDVKSSPSFKFVLANYVAYVKDSNTAMFNLIIEVAIGHILANTILYADKLQKYAGKFKGLCFYIDVRFIFRLFGYEGDLFRSAYDELIKALKDQGAELCIFSDNYEEVIGVLKGAVRWIDAPDYDPTQASHVLRYYRNAGKNKADVQHDLATIDERMKKYEICIADAPEFIKSADKQIDEKELQESINKVYSRSISFDPIEKKPTIEKDIKSIAAIHHIRKTARPLTIKQAQYFFLTSNSGLAYASRRYEMKDSGGENFIPACVTDVFVGTLVWMQSPVRWVELNQKKFLADCMTLLDPSPAFIKKLVDEAKKLKSAGRLTDDEFMVVRSSIYVQQALMQETYGNPDSINSESIEDVINRIRSEATAPLVRQIQHKNSEIFGLEQRKAEVEQKEQEYKDKLENIAVDKANIYTRIISFVLWGLFIIGLTASFIDWAFWVKKFLQILSACFGITGFGFGFNIKNIRKNIFSHFLAKVRKKYELE